MAARTIQKELRKLDQGHVPKLTVRQHLETKPFQKSPEVQSEKLQELKELVSTTFSNDAVADELALRIEGLATALVADMSTTGQNIPVRGQLNQWFMQKAFRLYLKGCSRPAVARQLGVSEQTHYVWLKEGQKYLEKYEKDPDLEVTAHQLNAMIYYEGVVTAEGVNANELTMMIHEAAKDDWRAAAHILARRYAKEWGAGVEKISVEVSGEVEVKHTGVLAVSPVAASIEDWQGRNHEVIDVEVSEFPDLTRRLQMQEEND